MERVTSSFSIVVKDSLSIAYFIELEIALNSIIFIEIEQLMSHVQFKGRNFCVSDDDITYTFSIKVPAKCPTLVRINILILRKIIHVFLLKLFRKV